MVTTSSGKNEELANFVVNVWILQDPIKISKTVTCGTFQIYFYENLFFPDENSKTRSYKKLTNNAIDRLLNELSTLDRERNEQLTNKYIRQKQINMT